MRSFQILTISVLALQLVSCSKIKEFQKKTDKMAKTTRTMKKNTENLGQWSRAGETETKRNERFELILNSDTQMGTKLYAAGVYFKAFEFQLWSGSKDFDTLKFRDKMFFDAASEFFRRLSDLHPLVDNSKMSPTHTNTKRHNEEMAFYALAATLHMTHNFQDLLTEKNPDLKHVSFFELMIHALKKDFKNKKLEEYQEIFVNNVNKTISIDLLKARYNFMMALALKNLTDKEQMSTKQKLSALLFKMTKGKRGSVIIPSTVDKTNETTKMFALKYLNFASETKKILNSINEEVNLDPILAEAFRHVNLTEKGKKSSKYAKKINSHIKSIITE
jgi:hypothetical protein